MLEVTDISALGIGVKFIASNKIVYIIQLDKNGCVECALNATDTCQTIHGCSAATRDDNHEITLREV